MNLLKNFRPFKLLPVVIAGMFLLFTQACTPADATAPNRVGANSEIYVPKGDKVNSPYEGGMNNFSDTDPRSKTNIKPKAEALKQNAEQNVIDQTGSLAGNTRRTLDKKGENLQDLGNNLQNSAGYASDKVQENTTNFAKGTKRGLENIGDNTKDAGRDLTKNTQRTAEDASDAVNSNAKDAARNLNQNVQRKFDNASNFIQDKTDDAVRGGKRNLDKAGNAVKDAVD